MRYFVYILANRPNGTLYIGVTNTLVRRLHDHHHDRVGDAFTSRYRVFRLVHFEETTDVRDAIAREKQLKHWKRAWKVALIEQANPLWLDLTAQ